MLSVIQSENNRRMTMSIRVNEADKVGGGTVMEVCCVDRWLSGDRRRSGGSQGLRMGVWSDIKVREKWVQESTGGRDGDE